MHPELYERYLAKKAKKLGISVDELKARSSAESGQTFSNQTFSNQSVQTASNQFGSSDNEPLQAKPEKVEIPSYVFGPTKMEDTPNVSQTPVFNDNRENKFALIGYPLGHSLSKVIHEAGFKSLGIDATYEILETPPDGLVDRIKYLKVNGYKGFNVTIPLKLPISLFVNEVDKYADLSRAVNTVYIDENKFLKAYNTDVNGFKSAIPSDIDLRGKKVAILGTGGAAHAACVALSELNVAKTDFFTRNIPNSIDFINYFRRQYPSMNFDVYQIENIRSLEEYDLLVNATPIGMLGKAGDMSPVELNTLQTLNKDAVVYDVIYNPKRTVLIKMAEKLRLRTITGLDMLIYQAVAAQKIWFGTAPDFKDMKIAALEEM